MIGCYRARSWFDAKPLQNPRQKPNSQKDRSIEPQAS